MIEPAPEAPDNSAFDRAPPPSGAPAVRPAPRPSPTATRLLRRGAAWSTRAVARAGDLLRVGSLYDRLGALMKPRTRPLTAVEMAEARRVFGDAVPYRRVRIDERSVIAALGARLRRCSSMGVAIAHTVHFNRPIDAAPGSVDMAWLIHELTHVAQMHAVGLRYLGEAIAAQYGAGYCYGGRAGLRGRRLADFNREQQGDIMRDAYRALVAGDPGPYRPYIEDARAGRY